MTVRKFRLSGVLGLIGLIGLFLTISGCDQFPGRDKTDSQTDAKHRPTAEETRPTIKALGRVEPASGIIELSLPPGVRILSITEGLVPGAVIKQGQVLLRHDGEIDLDLEEKSLTLRQSEAKARMTLAREERELAEKTLVLQRAELGLKARDLALLQKKLAQMDSEFQRAEELKNKLLSLKNQGAASPKELEDAQTAINRSRTALEAERSQYESQRELKELGTQKLDLEALRIPLEFRKAEQLVQLGAFPLQWDVLKDKREKLLVKAPITGAVLDIQARPGQRASGQPLIRMADLSVIHVIAEVDENDAPRLRIGQKASISARPLGEERFSGSVIAVNRMLARNAINPLDPTSQSFRRIVETRILVDQAKLLDHLIGMQVDVTITIDAAPPAAPAPAAGKAEKPSAAPGTATPKAKSPDTPEKKATPPASQSKGSEMKTPS